MASGIPEKRVFILRGHVKGKTSLSDLIDYAKLHGLPPVQTQPVSGDTLACMMFSNGTGGFSKRLSFTCFLPTKKKTEVTKRSWFHIGIYATQQRSS